MENNNEQTESGKLLSACVLSFVMAGFATLVMSKRLFALATSMKPINYSTKLKENWARPLAKKKEIGNKN